jgi:hypothetical protein
MVMIAPHLNDLHMPFFFDKPSSFVDVHLGLHYFVTFVGVWLNMGEIIILKKAHFGKNVHFFPIFFLMAKF